MGRQKFTTYALTGRREQEAVYTIEDLQRFKKTLGDGQEFEWDDPVEDGIPGRNHRYMGKVRRTYVIMNRWPHFVDAYRKDKPVCRKSFTYAELLIGMGGRNDQSEAD